MATKKADKDYTKPQNHLLISPINDYSLFGAHDQEIIRMLSQRIGKEIQKLLYWLKKEALKKRGESELWLDYYSRYQFVEYYRKSMEKLEFVKKIVKSIDRTNRKKRKSK